MSAPRYRTLDGAELELPLAMDHWVLVPRGLARFDPELAWTLDYEDAPEPDDADPRLDFAAGALLVPVERWNEHAELEPNLGSCRRARTSGSAFASPSPSSRAGALVSGDAVARGLGPAVSVRVAALVLTALAGAYVFAVGAWLWSLRDGASGPDVSAGLLLVGMAVLLAWAVGVIGVGWRRTAPAPRPMRTWSELGGALLHLTDDPLRILRGGLALQLIGFALLMIAR